MRHKIVAAFDRANDRFFANSPRADRAVTIAAVTYAGGFTTLAFFL